MAIQSLLVIGGILPFHYVLFHKSYLWKFPPQIWRLLSSFLMTGGGLSFLFDLYFTWMYGTGLELNSPRFGQPGDFFTYVVFLASVILVSIPFLLFSVIANPRNICPPSLL